MSEKIKRNLSNLIAKRKLIDAKILALETKLENPHLVRKTYAKRTQNDSKMLKTETLEMKLDNETSAKSTQSDDKKQGSGIDTSWMD